MAHLWHGMRLLGTVLVVLLGVWMLLGLTYAAWIAGWAIQHDGLDPRLVGPLAFWCLALALAIILLRWGLRSAWSLAHRAPQA